MMDQGGIPDNNTMATSKAAACNCAPGGRLKHTSVVERTLESLSHVLETSVFSEKVAARPGFLQGIDSRVKVLGILLLLVTAALIHNAIILGMLYGASILLAKISLIPTKFFIKRVWLFIPLFAGIIAIPSLFNIVRAGDPLFTIIDFGREVRIGPWSIGNSLAVTRQGANGAVIFILRVATSVSLAVLMALTTRWSELLKALRVFYVPRVFILILSMTYRYIFQLLGLASDMFTARRSRMVGPSSPRDDRRFISSSMGTLLGKSQALSEDVYAAMVSRGYNGEPKTLNYFSLTLKDLVFAAALAVIAAAAIMGDRLTG